MTTPAYTTWRKSRRSDANGNCVEVSPSHDRTTIAMRDSKNPAAAILEFDPTVWRAFIDDIRRGGVDS